MEEFNSGTPNTNPSTGREEDLNRGPPDYKSRARTNKPRRPGMLKLHHMRIQARICEIKSKQGQGRLATSRPSEFNKRTIDFIESLRDNYEGFLFDHDFTQNN